MNTAEPLGDQPRGSNETDTVTSGCETPQRKDDHMSIVAQDMRQAQPPVSLPDGKTEIASSPFAEAYKQYRAAGWVGTIQLPKHKKALPPAGFTGDNGKDPSDRQCELWSCASGANIGLRVPGTIIAVDVDDYDDKQGGQQLAAREAEWGELPPTVMSTSRGYGVSGKRFYRVPAGMSWPTEIADDIEIVQHRHRYAMVWPSVVADKHDPTILRAERWYDQATGKELLAVPDLSSVADLPQGWVNGMQSETTVPTPDDLPKEVAFPDGNAKGWLDSMLLDKADPGRGNGRSLSVAGGIVSQCVKHGLPYKFALAVVYNYEGASDDPQAQDVIQKQVQRTWAKEVAKHRGQLIADFTEATGFLKPREDGHGLVTLTDNRFGKPEETPFGDFTITATGVYTRDGNTVWTVDLTNGRGREERDVEMPHDVLASTAKLRAFLLGHRCTLVFSADRDKRGPAGVRLQALLESQNPADYRVVDRIGWDDNAQAFITFEGAITANGLDTSVAIRPNRSLTQHKQVNHAFGFRPEEEVREVVREVMTFQEETYASVYGSWYLAGVVKGQLLAAGASLFPFLCVEAPAEAGKSQGYPVFWYQLTGSVDDKGGRYTQPTFRDAVASRRGPAVWVDDVSSLDAFKDDLRQATVEGHAIKMGEDRSTQVQRKLTAPIVISVEGAGSIHQEKAMKDRSLLLNTPPVKERMSLNDPTRKQWDDITALQARYPEGLSVMAGTLVQMALRYAPARIAEFRDLRIGSGRHADKMATLRVGARILADITGDDEHIKRVDAWANGQEDTGAENVFTQKVVPNAILVHGLQEKPLRLDKAPHYGVASPVLFRPAPKGDGHHQLAVCLPNLALWHEKATPMGKVADRTETLSALMLQAAQLKMRGGKAGERGVDWYQAGVAGESSKMAYQVVPDDVTVKIFERLGIEWSPEDDAEPVKAKLTPSQAEAVRRA